MSTTPLETGLRLRAVQRAEELAPHAPAFDPWRFGTLRIPRDLRQELIDIKLPEIPAERLYVSRTAQAHPPSPVARFGRAALRRLVLGSAVVAFFAALARFWN